MATEIDPAGIERRSLLELIDFHNSRVLEVGAGDGRLTFRYSEQARSVAGIDTNEQEIRSAAVRARAELRGSARFLCGSGATLPFRAEAFEIALLASSL